MPTLSRRQVLRGAATIAGMQVLSPFVFRGNAFGDVDPATQNRYRLVLIDLFGGNDGLNTVVPMSGTIRQIYDNVRPGLTVAADTLLPLGDVDGGTVGLNPNLDHLYGLWQQDRVAIVQGVDYPNHDYSHFESDDIWQSGFIQGKPTSGWLGRHLDRTGIAEGELRGVSVSSDRLPLAIQGENQRGEQINSVYDTQFSDGGATGYPGRRHEAYAGYAAATDPLGAHYGAMCAKAADLAIRTAGLSSARPGGLASHMLTARTLMTANLGVEVVIITIGGFDTHDNQLANHAALLRDIDQGIEAFFLGTRDGVPIVLDGNPIGPLPQLLSERTLVMTFSEFGRRIGQNGTGTDHGAAGPMFVVGPPAPAAGSGAVKLNPGLHRDHPSLGSVALPADNLGMTTDVRAVYQAVLTKWLNDASGPSPDEGDPVFQIGGYEPDGSLPGLFGVA